MDAIDLLKSDHRTVDELFDRFEQQGPRARKTKQKLVRKMIEELSVHATIEEQLFYPTVRERIEQTEEEVLEDLEEHHVVKWLLSELDGMDPEHERFDAKVQVLIETVRHHVKEEERELLPKVRRALPAEERRELGEQLAAAKKFAPTGPHPRGPDEPPANLVAGPAAKGMDVAKERIRQIASGEE
jgi:hemerythrin superfamily protein